MRKTKKAIASLAIAGMVLSMAPMSVFGATTDSNRLAGAGRVETAIAIAAEGWADGAESVIVVPADDANIVDALAAAPLAGQLDAPILVTYKDALDPQVQQKIVDLKAKNVYAIGALSADTVASLKAISGVTVEQIQGADRIETAAKVSAKLTNVAGSFVVAYNGEADALSAASFAAANNYSIVVADPEGKIPAGQTATYTVGGQVSVDGATALAGVDRYATNNKVLDGLEFNYDKVYVANGQTLVDALAGAPLAAQTNSPIVLGDAVGVATGANDNLTADSQVIALGGTGAVSDSVLAKVAPVVSDDLEVNSVSATNLKEVVVEFNNEVNEDTVDAANFDVSDFTGETVDLQDDGKTVIVTLKDGNVFSNDTEYSLEISDVEDLQGNVIADTDEDFTVADYALPELDTIVFTGPQTAELTFSEPVDPSVLGEVTVDNGVYSATFADSDFDGNVVSVDLGTELDEGEHSIKVKGFADYVPYTMIANTVDVTYTDVTEAPEITVKEASQTKVTLSFNRPVKGLETASFYHTYSAWTPLAVVDKNGADVVATNYYDEVTLEFTDDSNVTTDRPLPSGNVKLVVLDETDENTIKDRWGNALDGDVTLNVNILADSTAPTVSKITVLDDQQTVKVYFSEEVSASSAQNADNVSITNPDGDVIKTYDYTRELKPDGDDYYLEIVFDDVQDEGTYEITLEGIKDVSLAENKMESVTKSFDIEDKTGISLASVNVTAVDADDVLYIDYGTEMATTGSYSVLNLENYQWGATAETIADIDEDDVTISMFTDKIVKITFDNDTTLVDSYMTIARVEDAKGNLTDEIAYTYLPIQEEAGPVITQVTKVDDNKLELKVNKELKSVKTAGITVNQDGLDTATTVAGISFVNDGNKTIIKVTLDADEKDAGTAPLQAGFTINVVTGNIKSVTGAYMANDTIVFGEDLNGTATGNGWKDGVAPEIAEIDIDGNTFDGESIVYVSNQTNNLIDTIKIKYSEGIDTQSVSKYTYNVGGYEVNSVTFESDGFANNVVVLHIENEDSKETDDKDATPTVTQMYDIEDLAGNSFMAEDSIEALSIEEATTATLLP